MGAGDLDPKNSPEMIRDIRRRLAEHDRALKTKATRRMLEEATANAGGNTYQVMFPIGSPYPVFRTTLEDGEVALEGQVESRTGQYARLFAEWGETFGAGDGSTTFQFPDLRGVGVMGYFQGQSPFDAIGNTGGETEHTLTEAEIPSHTHNVSTRAGGVNDNGTIIQRGYLGSAALKAQSTNSAGGDEVHNVLDPYITARWVARYQTVTAPPAGSLAAVAATPDTVALRDGNGNFSVADPVDATHAATKGYVDTMNGPGAQLSGSANLNNYQTPGNYFQDLNSGAAGGSNYPANYAGMLEVRVSPSGNFVYQTYTCYRGASGGTRRWVRNFYSGTWGAWNETT